MFNYRWTQSSITAFPHVLLPFWESKVLLPFGEVGLPSFLDTAFKEAVDLVSMNTLRGFTVMYWWTATKVSFSFLVVLLLKCLPIWLSAHLKPSKSGFKHSHLMLRAWLMAFRKYIHQKAFTGKTFEISIFYFPVLSCVHVLKVPWYPLLADFTGVLYRFWAETLCVISRCP